MPTMSDQDKVDSYIRHLPKKPYDKYLVYEIAKQFYELNIGWSSQLAYNRFICLVCARIEL